MDTIDTYFPYAEYRPGQRHMLEVAVVVGGIISHTASACVSVTPALMMQENRFCLSPTARISAVL
jgi:hypothetical protein